MEVIKIANSSVIHYDSHIERGLSVIDGNQKTTENEDIFQFSSQRSKKQVLGKIFGDSKGIGDCKDGFDSGNSGPGSRRTTELCVVENRKPKCQDGLLLSEKVSGPVLSESLVERLPYKLSHKTSRWKRFDHKQMAISTGYERGIELGKRGLVSNDIDRKNSKKKPKRTHQRPSDGLIEVEPPLDSVVGDVYSDATGWDIPASFKASHPVVASEIEKVVVSTDPDSLVWTCSLDGVVSCKSAYDSLSEVRSSVFWGKQIWASFIPPSRSVLIWRLFHGKIPTDIALRARGFISPSRCRFCCAAEEDLRHLFLNCFFVRGLWDAVSSTFGHKLKLDGTCLDLWQEAMRVVFSTQMQALWRVSIITVFWVVWFLRNQATFEGGKPVFTDALSMIWRSVREADSLQSGTMKNSVVNTDGAAFGSPGLSGCAGVFRTCRGFVRGCFAIPLGVCFAFEAELAAAIHAIDYAWTFGWHRLWLESDSTFVVNILRSRSRKVPWHWRPAWDRCLCLISQMDFAVTHIYREGNQVADSLASRSPSIVSPTWWWTAPSFCNSFIFNDFCCRPSFRFC
ncbi:hypothetical protein LWI29_010426 [Acer saccharum]|uniref:RNase H type-1 domain-containing protein n=1 Tax=Acer saccharum TaxID=4024 RepID=A0AA39W2K5_ACESA|nr:hypothetical protein LWI29_010426 [Acer saccharum]